jgi:hypothetical protein
VGRGVKRLRGGDGTRVCGARQSPGTHELHWVWELGVGGSCELDGCVCCTFCLILYPVHTEVNKVVVSLSNNYWQH